MQHTSRFYHFPSQEIIWLKTNSTNLIYVRLDIHTHLFRARLDSLLEFSSPAVIKKKEAEQEVTVHMKKNKGRGNKVGRELVH